MKLTTIPDMPKYVRSIEATAARITGWGTTPTGRHLTLDNGAGVDVSHTFVRMYKPKIGDYFVASPSGNVRTQGAERFHQDYQPAPNLRPIAWPEIERLASMQPQAEFVTKMCEPVQRGGDIFGTRAQMDVILGKGVQ